MLTVPFIAFLAGFGWACFGIMISGLMKSFENFNYVVSGVLTPMMLTAGTFFPLSGLPGWAQTLGNFNPLHHCVELVRHAAFGWDPGADALHLAALVFFGVLTWRIAVWAMTRKLVT
jgi:lipooligosaccharide transport system permease protein